MVPVREGTLTITRNITREILALEEGDLIELEGEEALRVTGITEKNAFRVILRVRPAKDAFVIRLGGGPPLPAPRSWHASREASPAPHPPVLS